MAQKSLAQGQGQKYSSVSTKTRSKGLWATSTKLYPFFCINGDITKSQRFCKTTTLRHKQPSMKAASWKNTRILKPEQWLLPLTILNQQISASDLET